MQEGWRWSGPQDPVALDAVPQTGALTPQGLRDRLARPDGLGPDRLRAPVIDLPDQVAPVAQRLGLRRCGQPGDPPVGRHGGLAALRGVIAAPSHRRQTCGEGA
jgi:D-mannonate dehydratase